MGAIVVLISGRGSNLHAICNAGLDKVISCVISNKANAEGLAIAKSYNIPTHIIEHTQFATRELFDKAVAQCIDSYNPELVVLAGFMRILSAWFVNHYTKRMINIHPSLLPAFPGSKPQADAVMAQVKLSGATVHFVTETIDSGPILAQGIVAAKIFDTIQTLSSRILALEHILYPFVIKKLLAHEFMLTEKSQVIIAASVHDAMLLGKYKDHIYY